MLGTDGKAMADCWVKASLGWADESDNPLGSSGQPNGEA
jgi:hypothetical protein